MLVVYESMYAATLSVRTSAITAVVLGVLVVAGITAVHVHRQRTERVPPGAEFPAARRRSRWPGRLFAAVWAITAFVFVVTGLSDAALSTQARAGDVGAGVLFALLAVDTATGRLASDVRRYRAVTRANPRMRSPLLATLIIGTVLVLFGLAGFLTVNGLRTHGARTTALVTNVTHFRSSTYFLRYRTTDGRTVSCSTERVGGSPEPGNNIEVLYDTQHPSTNCRDARLGTSFTEPTVITAIGIGFLAAWRLLYVRARRTASL